MEVLRKKLHYFPRDSHIRLSDQQQLFDSTVEDISYTFLNTMFNILSKYDLQILSICETVRNVFYV